MVTEGDPVETNPPVDDPVISVPLPLPLPLTDPEVVPLENEQLAQGIDHLVRVHKSPAKSNLP